MGFKKALTLVSLIASLLPAPTFGGYEQGSNVKVCFWNMSILGEKKAKDRLLIDDYVKKLRKYNIAVIQEIKDDDENPTNESIRDTAFGQIYIRMRSDYDWVLSKRAGKSQNKERYGLLYKREFTLMKTRDYTGDYQNLIERPPYMAVFDIFGYSLILFAMHTKPTNALNDIENLERIVHTMNARKEGNIIIGGDLNADCDYCRRCDERFFLGWNWLIKSSSDTTVGNTDCAYDRIIANPDAMDEVVRFGVDKDSVMRKHSDHYPVWVELKPSEK